MVAGRDTSADAFAQMQADEAHKRDAADARSLSGGEVARLRRALEASATALSRINDRGLPFAHRREFTAARDAIADARPLVAQRTLAGAEGAG